MVPDNDRPASVGPPFTSHPRGTNDSTMKVVILLWNLIVQRARKKRARSKQKPVISLKRRTWNLSNTNEGKWCDSTLKLEDSETDKPESAIDGADHVFALKSRIFFKLFCSENKSAVNMDEEKLKYTSCTHISTNSTCNFCTAVYNRELCLHFTMKQLFALPNRSCHIQTLIRMKNDLNSSAREKNRSYPSKLA